jgi:hypothetical protein
MATATLALRRNGRIFDHRHAWRILLDGQPAGCEFTQLKAL